MRRGLIFCSALLALPACWYESTADLQSSGTAYYVTGAFPAGDHVFQTADQRNVLAMQVEKEVAQVAYQNEGNTPMQAEIVTVLASESFPDSTYVAVQVSRKKDGTQVFRYYPFTFGDTHISWLRPASPTEVTGLPDLSRHVQNLSAAGSGMKFDMVPPGERRAVLARFDAWHSGGAGAPPALAVPPVPLAAPPAAPPSAAQPTVSGMSVGDGVYVSGFFSDSPSIIQEIDESGRRVKVRRYSDGVSEWVAFDRIISRDESTVNNVARGVATVGVFVCLLNPDACAGDRQ